MFVNDRDDLGYGIQYCIALTLEGAVLYDCMARIARNVLRGRIAWGLLSRCVFFSFDLGCRYKHPSSWCIGAASSCAGEVFAHPVLYAFVRSSHALARRHVMSSSSLFVIIIHRALGVQFRRADGKLQWSCSLSVTNPDHTSPSYRLNAETIVSSF